MAEKQNKVQTKSFGQTIATLALSKQFYWFVGHALEIIFFILNMISSFFSRTAKFYNCALVAVLFTYGIVIKQIHFKKTGLGQVVRDRDLRARMIRDDNVQYFLLALVFLLSSGTIGGVAGGLYSFTIFSVFHVLTYFQTNLLGSMPFNKVQQENLNAKINHFTTTYNQQALLMAANAEFLLLSGFIFTIPLMFVQIFRIPLFVIVNTSVFAAIVVFLKLRYISNRYTQEIVSQWDMKINQVLLSGKLPASLNEYYNIRLKGLIQKLTDPIQLPAIASTKKSN
ncbi:uncharacterized protein AC631_04445 [Debaryomyces fabryi]|uniref:Uncharacterized protein n=1 Tax=Debaryomyces fabryi TaxID=58627 RepID=A0A0V1PUX9_9ASCO|nr:uncharacterized protein AC631_04445 [Debaryomyces fabryi]KRZ99790.1 hypothetical protein AC631_04445 [Debaryomyces fabryi]CUM56419.1 unnamed protein product [Debaryomyces fabryi]